MPDFRSTGLLQRFPERALILAESETGRQAELAGGRVSEHDRIGADGSLSVDWNYNCQDKTNIFRPWGYQTGHLTEWAKPPVQMERWLQEDRRPNWFVPRARHFFDTAIQRGWDATHGDLVYGFDTDGAVCDGAKYFWVQAKKLAAAALRAMRTSDTSFRTWYDRIRACAWRHFVGHEHGVWYRILEPDNTKVTDQRIQAGKTDYHTMGACYDVLRGLGA